MNNFFLAWFSPMVEGLSCIFSFHWLKFCLYAFCLVFLKDLSTWKLSFLSYFLFCWLFCVTLCLTVIWADHYLNSPKVLQISCECSSMELSYFLGYHASQLFHVCVPVFMSMHFVNICLFLLNGVYFVEIALFFSDEIWIIGWVGALCFGTEKNVLVLLIMPTDVDSSGVY